MLSWFLLQKWTRSNTTANATANAWWPWWTWWPWWPFACPPQAGDGQQVMKPAGYKFSRSAVTNVQNMLHFRVKIQNIYQRNLGCWKMHTTMVLQDTSNRAQSKWKPQMPQRSSHSNENSLEKIEESEDWTPAKTRHLLLAFIGTSWATQTSRLTFSQKPHVPACCCHLRLKYVKTQHNYSNVEEANLRFWPDILETRAFSSVVPKPYDVHVSTVNSRMGIGQLSFLVNLFCLHVHFFVFVCCLGFMLAAIKPGLSSQPAKHPQSSWWKRKRPQGEISPAFSTATPQPSVAPDMLTWNRKKHLLLVP